MKKTSSLANAKRKVAFAEAQLRIAKRKLAESKRLNEDVNGYTFNESEENHSWVDDVDTNGESMVKHLLRVARLEDEVDEETLETLEAIFEETFWETDYKSEKEAARAVKDEFLNLG